MFLKFFFCDFQNIGTSEHADSKYVIRFVLSCQEDCLKNRRSLTEEALSQENCMLIFFRRLSAASLSVAFLAFQEL